MKLATSKAIPALDPVRPHVLKSYSLRGSADALQRVMNADRPILKVARAGQATVIYGAPNTGKTLLMLRMLGDAISCRLIDPDKVTYINADDTSIGLLEKTKFAEGLGFHVVAPGHKGFGVEMFNGMLRRMTADGSARGEILIADTLKRFVDPMDKSLCRAFTETVRQFVLAGGTLIALAHTNKHKSFTGKPVPGGTSDILDDFDCAYTLAKSKRRGEPGRQYVEFVNIKSRGNVSQRCTFSYQVGPCAHYQELLHSVREEDGEMRAAQPVPIKSAVKNLPGLVPVIERCIGDGGVQQTKLVKEASRVSGHGLGEVLAVLKAHCGDDPKVHRWGYWPGRRGAKLFYLHPNPINRLGMAWASNERF